MPTLDNFIDINRTVRLALDEDIKSKDITTAALFMGSVSITAKIISGERGIICGLPVVEKVFNCLDKKIKVVKKINEGGRIRKGQVVCLVSGDARKILAGERTALNFLGRLSGVATLTSRYVSNVKPYQVKIMDTRKTTPGLRELEKYAVKTGGGANHRMGLWDQILIKDNHIRVYGQKRNLSSLIQKIRKRIDKKIKIEVEVENLRQFEEAIIARPDIIMLDNMRIQDIKKVVFFRNKLTTNDQRLTTKLEVSGGVTLKNIRAIAKTGVDIISIGALTHSARSLDFSMEVV
ncbi:MAG: carboxylating nicotinate-nucleotide diphosphorylase [Candidatus Omnitrophica bacterium]|nr:carboxylating nicotinate-nucleotide diphosphorylase [Candidatus Omnitrophota bacterium]